MDMKQLRVLVEVVRQGGFSSAAEAVFATQPTVSKAISALESEVGMPLLLRERKGVRLTQAGEIVHRRAIAILNQRDDLLGELDELRGLRQGDLHIGLPPLGSDVLFAPLLASYRERYPNIRLHLLEQGSQALEDGIRTGRIELAGSILPVADEFAWQPVRREPIMVLLPETHPLAGSPQLRLKQLRDTPFILFERGFALNQRIVQACQKRGFTPNETMRSGQVAFIVALVASGLGLALLPRMIAEQRRQPGVILSMLDERDLYWHMALIWRRGAFLSHAAQAWLALAQDVVAPSLPDGTQAIAPT